MSAPLRRTVLRSASKEVVIAADQPFCVIGERINPTGRPVFQKALREGDLSIIEKDVAAQVAGGANVLDINMGVPLTCLLYTSPSPRDRTRSRMPSSA